jgi:hypothetical protein
LLRMVLTFGVTLALQKAIGGLLVELRPTPA